MKQMLDKINLKKYGTRKYHTNQFKEEINLQIYNLDLASKYVKNKDRKIQKRSYNQNNNKDNILIKHQVQDSFHKNLISTNNQSFNDRCFTSRISQLVKSREQHEKIINNLIQKKSIKKITVNKQRKLQYCRNSQLNKKYAKILQQYKSCSQLKTHQPFPNPSSQCHLTSRSQNSILTQLNTPHIKKQLTRQQLIIQDEERSYILGQSYEEDYNDVRLHVNLMASLSQFQNQTVGLEQGSGENLYLDIVQMLNINSNKLNFHSFQITFIGNQGYNYINNQFNTTFKRIASSKNFLNNDFIQLLNFLTQNSFWDGLFRVEDIQNSTQQFTAQSYWGLCFKYGNYVEPILSDQHLTENEKKLLILNFRKDQYSDRQNIMQIDISLVLLYRLLNQLQVAKTLPLMLHHIFGYQFKSFPTNTTLGLLQLNQFIDRLRQIHQKCISKETIPQLKGYKQKYSDPTPSPQQTQHFQDEQNEFKFQLFGYNKLKQYNEKINMKIFGEKFEKVGIYQFRELLRNQKYIRKFSQNYTQVTIINYKELPVKSICLKHFHNHFVVLTLNVAQQALYFITFSKKFIPNQQYPINQSNQSNIKHQPNKSNHKYQSNQSNQKYQSSQSNLKQQLKHVKYRVCLVSAVDKMIIQCIVLQNCQSYPVYLPKNYYQIYIAQISQVCEQNLNRQQSFYFYMQSNHITSKYSNSQWQVGKQLQFQLRLKQQYKHFTQTILQQFIQFSFLQTQIIKFFSQKPFTPLANPKHSPHLTTQIIYSNKSIPIKSQTDRNQMETTCLGFNQLFMGQQQSYRVDVFRIHIKALDLWIDAVRTHVEMFVQYQQHFVLCDANYRSNHIYLKQNCINLIYLTKNTPIKRIHTVLQHHNKLHFSNQTHKFKIYLQQW